MTKPSLNYLQELESEAVYAIREVFGQFGNPAILFSGGKDSLVVTYLARKAFWPAPIPFPLLHIDTGHNFPEALEFRDRLVEKLGVKLIVGSVQKSIDDGRVTEEKGPNSSRNILQTTTLLDITNEYGFDALIGGARRDEEKARSKERFFSHRDCLGQWNPHNQRPELWSIFNGLKSTDEHFRVFPISNWTEMDIWQYILQEDIEIPSLYKSHTRKVIKRNNAWLPLSEFIEVGDNEEVVERKVRFRTLGDITITGGIDSNAQTVVEIIEELESANYGERSNRADDKTSDTAMEDRKRQGYF